MYSYYQEKLTVDHLSINERVGEENPCVTKKKFWTAGQWIYLLKFFWTTDPFYFVNKGLFQCSNIIAVWLEHVRNMNPNLRLNV